MSIYVENIGKVYIIGNGTDETPQYEFTTGRDSIGWNETVWGGKLNRSKKFTLENIDDVEIGQVPQCTIVFKYIKIEDFLILQEVLKERHIRVKYFDIDVGSYVVHDMAITGNDRKKIYAYGKNIIGMQDFTIKLVGTNLDAVYTEKKITYKANGGSGIDIENTYSVADQVRLLNEEESEFSKSGMSIAYWNTKADGTGKTYLLGDSITLWKDLTLFAIWE